MSITGSFNVSIGNASFQPVDPVAIGTSRLPVQFKNLPIINGVLQCVLTSVVALEQSIARTYAQRSANIATGQSLTILGKLVGRARTTTIDDDFRRYVRAQIAVNNSQGTFENILSIALLVLGTTYTGTYTLHNEGTATARLTVLASAVTDTAASILNTLEQAAVAVGVRLVIEYSPLSPATVFTLDAGPGLDNGFLATALG